MSAAARARLAYGAPRRQPQDRRTCRRGMVIISARPDATAGRHVRTPGSPGSPGSVVVFGDLSGCPARRANIITDLRRGTPDRRIGRRPRRHLIARLGAKFAGVWDPRSSEGKRDVGGNGPVAAAGHAAHRTLAGTSASTVWRTEPWANRMPGALCRLPTDHASRLMAVRMRRIPGGDHGRRSSRGMMNRTGRSGNPPDLGSYQACLPPASRRRPLGTPPHARSGAMEPKPAGAVRPQEEEAVRDKAPALRLAIAGDERVMERAEMRSASPESRLSRSWRRPRPKLLWSIAIHRRGCRSWIPR